MYYGRVDVFRRTFTLPKPVQTKALIVASKISVVVAVAAILPWIRRRRRRH